MHFIAQVIRTVTNPDSGHAHDVKQGKIDCESVSEAKALADHLQSFYNKTKEDVTCVPCGVLFLDKGTATLSLDSLRRLHDELHDEFGHEPARVRT